MKIHCPKCGNKGYIELPLIISQEAYECYFSTEWKKEIYCDCVYGLELKNKVKENNE